MRIKKNDLVIMLTGKDRGRTGRVLRVLPERDRLVVEGCNIVHRHKRATGQNEQSGVIPQEAAMHASNVAIYSEKAGRGVRIRSRFIGAHGQPFPTKQQAIDSFGTEAPQRVRKVRYAPKTGEIFD